MNYFEKELTKNLKENNITYIVLTDNEHQNISKEIQKKIKFVGAQIAWTALEKAVNLNNLKRDKALETIAEEILKHTEKNIIFLGDSAIDKAYLISAEDSKIALKIFSEIPQHTYITSENVCWIACISAEGYIDYSEIH